MVITTLKYLRHIDKNAPSIDSNKLESIIKMPAPTNKEELLRLLRMTNCLSAFIKITQI